ARLGLPRNTLRYRMERHGLLEGGGGTPRRRPDSGAVRGPVLEAHEAPEATGKIAASSSSVRWQRTRVTLMHARVLDADATTAEHERMRVIEDIGRKASSFGGRVIEVGPVCMKAVFGLDLIEDAARHAAHAAFAVQRVVGASNPPREIGIALHTEEMLVGRLEDRVELDADSRRAAEH